MGYPAKVYHYNLSIKAVAIILSTAMALQNTAIAEIKDCLNPPSMFTENHTALLQRELQESLEATLRGEAEPFGPSLAQYIKDNIEMGVEPYLQLAFLEASTFLEGCGSGAYKVLPGKDLNMVIESLINKWLCFFKNVGIEDSKDTGRGRRPADFAVWESPCKVKSVVLRDGIYYVSLYIINRYMGFRCMVLPGKEPKKDAHESGKSPGKDFSLMKSTCFFIQKFAHAKGEMPLDIAVNEPECRTAIQEIIDSMGWEAAASELIEHKDLIGTAEEITRLLEWMRREITRDAKEFVLSVDASMPKTGEEASLFLPLGQAEDIDRKWQRWREERQAIIHADSSSLAYILGMDNGEGRYTFKSSYPSIRIDKKEHISAESIRMNNPLEPKLADEVIEVLEDVAARIPRLKETLINSLIERIRSGRVFYGDHFFKSAVAAEMRLDGNTEYCIAVNHYIQKALDADPQEINKKSMRGLFLACILLGQESQIFLRRNKNFSWDIPSFNAAYIAQAAELAVLMYYRDSPQLLAGYNMFLDSLKTNVWSEVNMLDLDLHKNILRTGADYVFLEAGAEIVMSYKEILYYLSWLEFSDRSLKSANVILLYNLLREMGFVPECLFNDIDIKSDAVDVTVNYRSSAKKFDPVKENEIIQFVKGLYVPYGAPDEIMGIKIDDLLNKGVLAQLIIEIDPNAKSVRINADLVKRAFVVVLPVVGDMKEMGKKVEMFARTETGYDIVRTDAYQRILLDVQRDSIACGKAQAYINQGNLAYAKAEIEKRLQAAPKSLELGLFTATLAATQGEITESLQAIHDALDDARLYTLAHTGLLLRYINLAIEVMVKSNSPFNVSGSMRLARIARSQIGKYRENVRLLEADSIKTGRKSWPMHLSKKKKPLKGFIRVFRIR